MTAPSIKPAVFFVPARCAKPSVSAISRSRGLVTAWIVRAATLVYSVVASTSLWPSSPWDQADIDMLHSAKNIFHRKRTPVSH